MKRTFSKSKRICEQTECYYRDHLKEQIVILEAEIAKLIKDLEGYRAREWEFLKENESLQTALNHIIETYEVRSEQ